MTEIEFTKEMNRLETAFGQKGANQERTKIIWKEIKDFSASWLNRTVSLFIGNLRQFPLLSDFQEQATIERERLWKLQKQETANQAIKFMSDTRQIFDFDMIKSIIQTTKDRIEGRVPDAVFDNFKQGIQKLSSADCNDCDSSGYVFKFEGEYEYVYRCRCRIGLLKPHKIPLVKYEQA